MLIINFILKWEKLGFSNNINSFELSRLKLVLIEKNQDLEIFSKNWTLLLIILKA